MSNYPPGVTGMEPEINGARERTFNVDCGVGPVEILALPRSWVDDALHTVNQNWSKTQIARIMFRLFKSVLDDVVITTVDHCPFAGEVTGWEVAPLLFNWECPLCATLHDLEVDQ